MAVSEKAYDIYLDLILHLHERLRRWPHTHPTTKGSVTIMHCPMHSLLVSSFVMTQQIKQLAVPVHTQQTNIPACDASNNTFQELKQCNDAKCFVEKVVLGNSFEDR